MSAPAIRPYSTYLWGSSPPPVQRYIAGCASLAGRTAGTVAYGGGLGNAVCQPFAELQIRRSRYRQRTGLVATGRERNTRIRTGSAGTATGGIWRSNHA
jgi:hypothetical protein